MSAKIKPEDFAETSIWKSVRGACNFARARHEPVFVCGPSQIGKTVALEEYARRAESGPAVYTRMPAAPSLSLFLRRLARDCGKPAQTAGYAARENIEESFEGGDAILIVDEMHGAFDGARPGTGKSIAEFIREILDRTGIGVVFAGTRLMLDEYQGGRAAATLEQTLRRGIVKCRLPDIPPRGDVLLFAAAFGLPKPDAESSAIIDRILAQNGIGHIRSFLHAASNLAKNRNETLAWQHFRIAYDVVSKQ
jgi:Uncharacterized ATPase, putative transposase